MITLFLLMTFIEVVLPVIFGAAILGVFALGALTIIAAPIVLSIIAIGVIIGVPAIAIVAYLWSQGHLDGLFVFLQGLPEQFSLLVDWLSGIIDSFPF